MNKYLFRIVHNRALGLPQVAAEISRRFIGRAASAGRAARAEQWALWLLLGWAGWLPDAAAQIAADLTAPGSQRPTVLQAPNGVPLVNIQTPSAAGVSRNTYRQFDVRSEGAILNNSRIATQSQLGGWVQGNPWLATGSARIILNEVNASDPSQLRGYVEVAGSRAQVVVANPAGISCDGCGFINANQATLTTGIPILSDGRLDGYRVQSGTIQIEGGGLDARGADFTDLIARSVKVNAGIWGQELKVVAGANQIDADPAKIAPLQVGGGVAPAFALDVGALGGMYAGKIALVGTEHGVGVRNAGTIGAQAGDLVVTVDGRLENSGALQAMENTRIAASAGVGNVGTISAARELQITTGQDVDNSGGNLNAARLAVEARALRNRDGSIEQTGLQVLALQGGTLNNRGGGRVGTPVAWDDGEGSGSGGDAAGGQGVGTGSGSGGSVSDPGAAAHPVELLAEGMLHVADILDNDGGRINAGGGVIVAAFSLDNAGGQFDAHQLTVTGGDFGNRGGELAVAGAARISADQVDNEQGRLSVGGSLVLSATDLYNRDGVVQSNSTAVIAAAALDNTGGTVSAGDTLDVRIAGAADNRSGVLASGSALALHAGTLDNRQAGAVASLEGDLTLTTDGQLDNSGGLLAASNALVIRADSLLNRGTASLDSAEPLGLQGQRVSVTADLVDNYDGLIVADQHIDITGGSLDNSSGTVSSAERIVVAVGHVSNSGGTLLAGSDNIIHADGLAGDGRILSQGDLTLSLQQDVDHGGEITANGRAEVGSAGRLGNRGSIRAGDLEVRANEVDNTASGEIGGGRTHLVVTGVTVNRGLIDGQSTRIETNVLDNIGTGRLYGDHLALQAGTISNREETVAGVTRAATIAARERLDIGVQILINREQGLIFSAGAGDQALNIGGELDANGLATGRAGLIHNASATIESLGGLHLDAARLLNRNEHFASVLAQIVGPTRITYIQPKDDTNKYDISNFVWEDWSRAGGYRWKSDPPLNNSGVLGVAPVPRVGEQDCVGDGDNEVCTRLPGADYPAGDRAWTYFGVPAPAIEPARPEASAYPDQGSYQAALAAWRSAHAAWSVESEVRYEALDALIDAYNEVMTQHLVAHWTQYEVTRTEHRTQVTNSAPALIRSGGAMRLSGGELVNDKSHIIAGGALSGDLSRLQNVDAIGRHIVHEEGTSQYTHSRWRGGFKRYHQRDWDAELDYTPAAQVTRFNLNVVGVKTHASSGGSDYRIGMRRGGTVNDAITATPAIVTSPTVAGPGGTVDLPTSSLFRLQPESGSYLLETDPRFTDHRTWLSSDYLLQQLALDPVTVQKRLGDGFYEQRLIREQVGQLTGRRFLDGYASDEAQYQALLTAGATVAQAWNLRPGVALTAEQVAQLTSDIVWLVEEPVRLPDGSVTTALVPRVYLLPRAGDLDGNGTLLSAAAIALDLKHDLINSGTIAGRDAVQLTAENLRNLGGRIGGEHVSLHARTDLDNLGGTLTASDSLVVTAGRDLAVASTTQSDAKQTGLSDFSRSNLDRVAGLYITNPGGSLIAKAGRDASFAAAEVINAGAGGRTVIAAERDLRLGTVQVAEQENNVLNASNYLKQGFIQELGTTVHTQGDLHLQAGGDLSARAANVTSERGAVVAVAQGDVSIVAGEAGSNWGEGRQHKHSGLLGSSTKTSRSSLTETAAAGSTFSGNTVVVQGRNVTVTGSNVVADDDTMLIAKNDLIIEAATQTRNESHFRRTDKSGVFSGGVGVTIGKQVQKSDQEIAETTAAGSTIGSLYGDVKLVASKQYRQLGSDVLAPEGGVSVVARGIAITEAREGRRSDEASEFKQSGISVSVTAPVISSLQATGALASATRKVESGRMQALGVGVAALNAKDAYDSGTAIADAMQNGSDIGKASGVGVNVSLGSAKSGRRSMQTSDTAHGSTVQAGGNVSLVATGAGQDSNILIRGSEIHAGDNATLIADNRVDLIAAQNHAEQQSTDRSNSASVGIGFNASGQQSGLTLNAAAAQGRGKTDGMDAWHTNSRVTAGNTARLSSGGDTTIRGAQVTGHSVKADIGGDLNLESLQDTSAYASKQKNTGGGVSVCIPPLCAGPAISANVDLNRAKASGDYASVVEQSGIQAGDGGFNIRVDRNTDLTGAVIASTQAASDAGKNRLVTGTLTTGDIDNHAEASAKSSGISVSSDLLSQGKYGLAKAGIGTVFNKGSASDSSQGYTKSAVSAGEVVITDETKQQALTGGSVEETVAALNRDTDNTHSAAKELDVEKMEERAQAEQTIKQEAYRQISLITDAVYAADNGPKKIMLSTCAADSAECKSQEIDLDNHALIYGADGNLYLFNNGIFNDEDAALVNAAKQHGDAALAQGLYTIINPYTGNPLSEVIYAGLDKIREVTGLTSVFGVSNASQANIELRNMVEEYNRRAEADGEMSVMIFEVDHSRGSLTSSTATQAQIKAGETGAPLGHVLFHGAAANAQRMADRVEQATSGAGTVWQSTHKDDFVSTRVGGNKVTGGQDAGFLDAHGSYGPGIIPEHQERVWGGIGPSKPVRVAPTVKSE